jgi:two-component system, cell cycle response regulator
MPDPPDEGLFQTLVVEPNPSSRTAATRGVLTMMSGPETGRVHPIPEGGVLTLGRAPDCGIRIDDASVSGRHANIARIAGDYVFSDARSTNGSFVNDARVTTPIQLRDGDRIQLGSTTFLRFSLVSVEEEAALRRVYEAGVRDGLTGVYNRKHLEDHLDAEVSYANRHQSALSIVMLDIDHFKKVNDTYGHVAGDAVIRAFAAILTRALRAEDIVARYGGEEFTIVARGIDVQAAAVMAERVRHAVTQQIVPFGPHQIRFTSSAGVASLACCGPKRDRLSLVGLADQRLYRAKEQGRNRVVAT